MFKFYLHWIWDWLEIVITSLCACMSCEGWHGYSFISFLYWLWRTWESIGDLLRELFLQVIGLYMCCGCPWYYMDSLIWDVVSELVINLKLSFAVGASWYICGRYCSWGLWLELIDWICWWCEITWYTFGGMGSWMGLALVVGAISAMDILTTIDTCEYLWIRFFFLAFQLV